MKKILLATFVLALFTTAASAQKGHDAIQRHRIENGFQSGQLTRGERFELQNDHGRYEQARRIAMRDGRITPAERRKLNALKRNDNRRTYAMKHNNRRRVF
jgi:hypothetical protein